MVSPDSQAESHAQERKCVAQGEVEKWWPVIYISYFGKHSKNKSWFVLVMFGHYVCE